MIVILALQLIVTNNIRLLKFLMCKMFIEILSVIRRPTTVVYLLQNYVEKKIFFFEIIFAFFTKYALFAEKKCFYMEKMFYNKKLFTEKNFFYEAKYKWKC